MTLILNESRSVTAGDLVTSALKKARVLGSDQTLSPDMMADGIMALNQMLDSWWLERLAVYRERQDELAWSAGEVYCTIGSGGNFDVTRPVRVTGAFWRLNNIDYPVTVLTDRAQYDSEPLKSTQGIPSFLYYDADYPLGKLYLFPVPNAAGTLFLNSYQQIERFTDKTDAADLPPGYDRAVVHNLAVEIAPEYGQEAPPTVQRIASQSKAALKRVNAPAPVLTIPGALMKPYHFDINRGR